MTPLKCFRIDVPRLRIYTETHAGDIIFICQSATEDHLHWILESLMLFHKVKAFDFYTDDEWVRTK